MSNHLIDVQQIKNVYNTQKQLIKLGLLNKIMPQRHFCDVIFTSVPSDSRQHTNSAITLGK